HSQISQSDVLADGSLQLFAAILTAGHEIEVKALLFPCWRIWSCDCSRNGFSSPHELDLNHCALGGGEVHARHSFRSKTKTFVFLWDLLETPSTRLRVIFLFQPASSALVLHITCSATKSQAR